MTGNILVTGGAGYIGSHAAYALLEAGYKVLVLDNLSTGQASLVPDDAVFAEGGIEDHDLVSGLIQDHTIDAVVHFAGSVVVPESVRDPIGYYRNNTGNSAQLLRVCIEAGIKRFVFSSTAAVYGDVGAAPVVETIAAAPITPYGWSKLMIEDMLADAARAHDFRYVALRYFNVAGADPAGRSGQCSPSTTHLIRLASQVALGQRETLEIYGDDYDTPDGTCIRDFVHVSDLADAHVLALKYLEDGGDSAIVNCGYGQGHSVREVVKALEGVSGATLSVRVVGRREGDSAQVVADGTKARELFQWSPKFNDLQPIIETMLKWERSNPT